MRGAASLSPYLVPMTCPPSTSRAVRFTAALLLAGSAGCGDETAPADPPSPDAGPLACVVGEREIDAACIAPGVPPERCTDGFEADGTGSCNPVLPADPCGPGEMAIPGETSCREVAPCPAGESGEAPEEPSTQHVRGDYVG